MDFLFLNSKAHLLLERSASEVSGGAELQVALLARELAAKGYRVGIVHGSAAAGPATETEGVLCIPGGPFHTGGNADILKAIGPVFSAIRTHRPKHVLVLGWTAWLFLLWIARASLRYRLVFICGLDTEADGSFARENGLRGRLFDFAMRRSDPCFAMTVRQAEMFRDRGIPCALYRNLVLPRQHPRAPAKDIDLLWVARCRAIKRPLLFPDIAAAHPDARCVMVCPPEDADLFARVRSRAAALPNLELVEFVPYHEIQALYDRAKILVNTSIAEGFANSFIQAGLGGAAILSLSVDCDGVLARFGAGACADDDLEKLIAIASRWLGGDETELSERQSGALRFVEENHGTEENLSAFLEGVGLSTRRVTGGH